MQTVHLYTSRPQGEVGFPFTQGSYRRELRRCDACGHFVSIHDMDAGALYEGEYVSATYGEAVGGGATRPQGHGGTGGTGGTGGGRADGMRAAFDRINALPPDRSDNMARVERVTAFADDRGLDAGGRTVLDVGSGLCVFGYRMASRGWRVVALDPDARAVEHARSAAGVEAVHGDFLQAPDLPRVEAVTFNKVAEHVEDPPGMLARALDLLSPDGFVYVEVPDGEAAFRDGPGREEFFVEHHHVFSPASLALTLTRAGFDLVSLHRIREPSTKYTLYAFAVVAGASPS